MSGDENRDVAARLVELEATVRGLTQELVSAEERIRQLEEALEAATSEERATKDTRAESQDGSAADSGDGADESGRDLDDIIVA